ncbi:alpha-amylase [Bdellovibrio sp. HCB2-146]|uniref:alpha-amylase n=1 Tax=Bdellovibrio sp. HCB2-146 TaxID=3394362 RepID=UPI0039BD8A1F
MSLRFLIQFILVSLISTQAFAGSRTVFLQMFEWPWKDIAKECEIYLGPQGFSAVQVSPPHEHIVWQNQPWWVRYQVVSYKIESRSGNEAEFVDMIQRCKKAGVDIYVDAVINHATGIPGGVGIGGSAFSHYDYPGLYQIQDFNHCHRNGNNDIKNYEDRFEVQYCELLDLADLATSSPYVQGKIAEYLNRLLDLGVAGFRIDAAKHIPAQDLESILSKLNRSAYIYSEVIPSGAISYEEYLGAGDVMAYTYSERIAHAVRTLDMNALLHAADGFPSTDQSVVFLTNHDLERSSSVLSYNGSESRLYRLAQVFLLSWPFGYPHLYTGYSYQDKEAGPPLNQSLHTLAILDANNNCRAPWTCEHRLAEVAAMVNFRNQTDSQFHVQNLWNNNSALAFSRGDLGFVSINFGSTYMNQNFKTSLPDGIYHNILSPTQTYRVQSGLVQVSLTPQSAVVLLRGK